ncbi:hypothetical protein Ddye_024353 [Dipteronia dyeriana]|uniref:non-specific serine/threonine protein kinase n=1 Tax=Dipteronia dyeriana TaxID=168575 RepID=A0AAD9TUM8_9ROSI|nr:hypothetical protein Ddye_024353 [Dipteronia dyeriana]
MIFLVLKRGVGMGPVRKKICSIERHGMIMRHSKDVALDLNQDLGKENKVPEVKKASWNLKEEIAKVINAGVVLGFDVNGRENDMVEEIVRRIETGTFDWQSFYINCGGQNVKVNGSTFEGDAGISGGTATYHLHNGNNRLQMCDWIGMFQDFNIEAEASVILMPVSKVYNATVTNNILEICFHWAGKGTTAIPIKGAYGPLVSAISGESQIMHYSLGFGYLLLESGHTTAEPRAENKHGLLSDGTIIAVKRLSSKSKQENREFFNEIGMISCLQHPNLVKFYGCCIEEDQLLLVYEYIENNSLARALFGHEQSQLKLDWPTSHRICLGIAKGLAFLHEESRFKIVHRDIKPTNVLLDRDLNRKISYFGLAELDEEEKTHISTRISGTKGYMAPEYALWGLTHKADVYGFGVVTFEIASGKNNTGYLPDDDCSCFLEWVIHLFIYLNLSFRLIDDAPALLLDYMKGLDRKNTKENGQINPTSPGDGVGMT